MAVRDTARRRLHPTVFVPALGVWVAFAVLAVANGLVRAVIEPRLAEPTAHVLSTAVLVVLVLAIAFVYFRRFGGGHTFSERVLVGGLWVALTVAFEFGVGVYVVGRTLDELLYDYALLDGRVYVFVLLALFLAPTLFARDG